MDVLTPADTRQDRIATNVMRERLPNGLTLYTEEIWRTGSGYLCAG